MSRCQSLDRHTAIDRKHFAGNIGSKVACEEHEGVRNVFRLANALERDTRLDGGDKLFGQARYHVGRGDARRNGVHADAGRTQFASKRDGETFTANLLMG